MSASVKDERLVNARRLSAGSALARRRALATYVISAIEYRAKSLWWLISAALVVIAAFIAVWAGPAHSLPHDRAVSLGAPTQARDLDRFTIPHKIQTGDTIWRLSLRYYGSSSFDKQQRLRDANTWLPDDPRQLKVAVVIKIPVI